jgi:hypothetical protein
MCMLRWNQVMVVAALVLAVGVGAVGARQAAPAAEGGKLKVTVEYKGQGSVSPDNRIWVWVFDTPNITGQTMPLGTGVIKENKGSYTFVAMPKELYIAVAYDNVGGYDGTTAPPPYGTPISIYGVTGPGMPGKAVATGGDDAAVTVVFDDSVKMQ